MKFILSLSMLILTMTIGVTLPVFGDNAIVYQKQLLSKNKIVVLRREGQYIPPSREVLKQFSPGVIISKPSHVYWYDFVVRSDHKQDKLLWSLKINEYDSMEGVYAKFQIFDVDLQDSNLIVTWLNFGQVCANIIKPDAQNFTTVHI